MINKLIIGTANFGLEYGIAGRKKLGTNEISKILEYTSEHGIWGLDTARAYGDAEEIIGNYFIKHGNVFRLISKLPKKEYVSVKDVEDEVYGSLSNMNISYMDCLLIHSYETYKQYGEIIVPVLRNLCRDKIIGRYGVSVYHPEEASTVVKELEDDLAIEFPLNLFDQRFLKDGLLQRLKGNGNLLFARSVFLQGLLFLGDDELKGKFENARRPSKRLREISEDCMLRRECIAMLFVLSKPHIDGMVIGIDSTDQLMGDIRCLSTESLNKYNDIAPLLSELELCDEDIILPYRWKV
ncbi:MAG: hypothetical protein A2Z47_04435 [Thermodesulfovibrio sp. RBG_19FT_COMBO_42_12]|nr:MAG: hypothetical protein A2Z47_04435 [Thermodesulfovibrio sp. RBG_19FT_COMBO_42_12]